MKCLAGVEDRGIMCLLISLQVREVVNCVPSVVTT